MHRTLTRYLLPSGLLVEGSADATGAVMAAHLLRRGVGEGAELPLREALLFHTDFSLGFAPMLFRDWLPRDLRRRVRPGEPIHDFFSAWSAAWQQARTLGHTHPPDAFREAALGLSARMEGVATDPWLLSQGYVVWRPKGASVFNDRGLRLSQRRRGRSRGKPSGGRAVILRRDQDLKRHLLSFA